MSTPVGYVLSAEQIKFIEKFLYYAQRSYKNRPLGALGDDAVEHEEFPSPEVYIARTPEEGIPGFSFDTDVNTGTGTGTGTGSGTCTHPDSAECEIYKIDFSNGCIEDAGFTKIVVNLSASAIDGNKWIITLRDKFGTWFAIPLPDLTRTHCDDGKLVYQTSVDGGETWETLEDLGVVCNLDTGTGTTSDDTSGGGPCELAKLVTTDCVLASGPENQIQLEYAGGGHWGSPAGTSSASLLTYFDGLCSGAVDFWYSAGQVHLSVGGIELLNCGNGCFTGGPLTGHLPCDTGTGSGTIEACQGRVFTVCVNCRECMYWYCVATEGECTGTGTPQVIEVLELSNSEALELGDLICAGPFETEADANEECSTITTVCCGTVNLPSVLQINGNNILCTDITYPVQITYNPDNGRWESGTICGIDGLFYMYCDGMNWILEVDGHPGVCSATGSPVVCDPFNAQFAFGFCSLSHCISGCVLGTLTVTE